MHDTRKKHQVPDDNLVANGQVQRQNNDTLPRFPTGRINFAVDNFGDEFGSLAHLRPKETFTRLICT